MKTINIILLAVLILWGLSFAPPAYAGEKTKDKAEFHGSFQVGYRGVDVDGHEEKYKEDYNLHSAPALFHLSLYYRPTGAVKKYVDAVDLHIHELGGEPFETFDIRVVKYGKYQFKYDRRKSSYFYQDHLMGHDFHHYDFDRINDSASLKIWLTRNVRFYMDFNSFHKKGEGSTSLDISRDEFEYHRKIEESSKDIGVGIDYSCKGFSIVLEERIKDYCNDYSFFLPGFSDGENAGDLTDLSYYNFYQPYDFRSYTHSARLTARPTDRFLIRAAAQLSNQDLRLDYMENAGGTTYLGSDFSWKYEGEGNYDRDLVLIDFDISYLVNSKFALVAGVKYNDMKQEGELEIYDAEMPLSLEYNTLTCTAGLQYRFSPKFTFSAGVHSETREVCYMHEGDEEEMKTKRTGLYGNFKFNFTKRIRFSADYQMGSHTDPFTDISPTDYHRARFTARYKTKACYFLGSYTYKLMENDIDDGWKSETSQASVRIGHHDKVFHLSLGYSLLYSKLNGERNFRFYGQPATWDIMYEGRACLMDAYVSVNIGKKATLGLYGNYYKNDGSWELDRLTLKPFVRVKFNGGFVGELSYSWIEFNEGMYHMNDYAANIFKVSFGYKW